MKKIVNLIVLVLALSMYSCQEEIVKGQACEMVVDMQLLDRQDDGSITMKVILESGDFVLLSSLNYDVNQNTQVCFETPIEYTSTNQIPYYQIISVEQVLPSN